MNPIRVALTVPSLRGGGLERVVRDLALTLRARDHIVGVFPVAGLGIHAAPLEHDGVKVFDCQESGFRIRGYPRRLIQALRSWSPDVIHAHSGTWFPASVAARQLHRPSPALVFTDHGRYPPESRLRAWTERWASGRTEVIAAVSTPLADYVHEFLRLDTRPEVIPNGIDLAPFQAVPPEARIRLRAEWQIPDDATVAIVVGRFVPVKNHRAIVRAFASMTGNTKLVLLGRGPLEAEIKAEVDRAGISRRVIFLGFRSDVPECLSAADLWVSGSTTEGQPIALLEAMAAGLPIMATAVGGVPETLGSPPAGVLVDPRDEAGFAHTLGALMTDHEHRNQLASRTRVRAHEFSRDRMTDRYTALYERAMQARKDL